MFKRLTISAGLLALGTGLALAQTTAPGAPAAGMARPGGTGPVAPQSGATGAPGAVTGTPTGRPEDNVSTSSSAGGNAGQPSRAVPQGGAGGGAH